MQNLLSWLLKELTFFSDLMFLNYLLLRLSENAHLPFDRLTALSKVEGLRYPHPSSLRAGGSAADFYVCLVPRDLSELRLDSPPCGRVPSFGRLAYGHLLSASQNLVFRKSPYIL
jgi:hypothetical protein